MKMLSLLRRFGFFFIFIFTMALCAQGPYDAAKPAPSDKELKKIDQEMKAAHAEVLAKIRPTTQLSTVAGDALKAAMDEESDPLKRYWLSLRTEKAYVSGNAYPEALEMMLNSEKIYKDPKISKRKEDFVKKVLGYNKGDAEMRVNVLYKLVHETVIQRDWATADKLFKMSSKFVATNKSAASSSLFTELLSSFNYLNAEYKKVKHDDKTILLQGDVPMVFCKIPKGQIGYRMLWNDGMGGKESRYFHFVITRDFYMARFELTNAQYEALMGANTQSYARFPEPNGPAGNISWRRSLAVCDALNARYGDKLPEGYVFRLPTIAEWHLAADEEATNKGNGPTRLLNGKNADGNEATYHELGYTFTNADAHPWPVGTKLPNRYGLYDTHGNASELNYDYGSPYYCPTESTPDPIGHLDGTDSYALTYCSASCRMDQRLDPRPVMVIIEDSRQSFSDSEVEQLGVQNLDQATYEYAIEHGMMGNSELLGMRVAIAPILPYERQIMERLYPDSQFEYVPPKRRWTRDGASVTASEKGAKSKKSSKKKTSKPSVRKL